MVRATETAPLGAESSSETFAEPLREVDSPQALIRLRSHMAAVLEREAINLRVAVGYLEESGATVPEALKELPTLAVVWSRTEALKHAPTPTLWVGSQGVPHIHRQDHRKEQHDRHDQHNRVR